MNNIYVAAFRPKAESDTTSVGGFQWFYMQSSAEEFLKGSLSRDDEGFVYCLGFDFTIRDKWQAVTDFVDNTYEQALDMKFAAASPEDGINAALTPAELSSVTLTMTPEQAAFLSVWIDYDLNTEAVIQRSVHKVSAEIKRQILAIEDLKNGQGALL